jgi:ribosomal protein S14
MEPSDELAPFPFLGSGEDILPVPSAKVAGRVVVVRCPECGTPRAISERQARRHSICRACFFGRPADASSYREFWTSRFTMREIKLMGAACFGTRRQFAEALAEIEQEGEWS